MKKLFVLLVIFAFFAPCFRPLAYAGGKGVLLCEISTKECEHGKSCPMKSHKGHNAASAVSHHIGHGDKNPACDIFFSCHSKGESSKNISPVNDDLPFVTVAISINQFETFEPVNAIGSFIYKDASPVLPFRPPVVL